MNAVTVCVNYSKYFRYTIQVNRRLFDKYIVVTHRRDEETQKLCRTYDCECVTAYFQKFPKGYLINLGLERCPNDWVAHIDADIILTSQYRSILRNSIDDKKCLYGAEGRIHLKTEEEIQHLLKEGKIEAQKIDRGGDLVGYLQIWHLSNKRYYSSESSDAGMDDVYFRDSFLPHHRKYIKVPVIHLGIPYINHQGIVQ